MAAVVALGAMTATALAVLPDEVLENPLLERRARDISKNLRCLVCQNQSIDDSDAELARDLRLIVRERLIAGDSDNEVIGYVVDRYGDYVLLNPPFKGTTYVLWIGPGVIAALGAMSVMVFFRRRARVAVASGPPPSLSAEEERRIQALLDEDRP